MTISRLELGLIALAGLAVLIAIVYIDRNMR